MERKKTDIINEAESRETSVEIMQAIAEISRSYSDAVRIWENPTNPELVAIFERVTKNGLIDSTEFCWGVNGSNWNQLTGD